MMMNKDLMEEIFGKKIQSPMSDKVSTPHLDKVKKMSLYDIAIYATPKAEFIFLDAED